MFHTSFLSRVNPRAFSWRIVAIGASCAFLAGAHALADPALTPLYDGEALAQAPASITPWGGGAVVDSTQANFTDQKQSILITTDGPYQGALFTLSSPVDVGDVASDKTHYVTIAITQIPSGPPQQMSVPKPEPKNAMPDQIGALPPPNLLHFAQYQPPQPGQMQPMPPGQMPPDQSQNPNGAPQAPPPPPINFMRMVITTESGATADCIKAVQPPLGNSNWSTIGFPLSQFGFTGADAADLKIKSVMIAGDIPARFFLGYVHVVTDSSPLVADIQGPSEVVNGTAATWIFRLNPGASNVSWTWKYDDGSPDEHGLTTTHTFNKTGLYHITLTVTDLDGIKAPISKTLKVSAEEQ